MSDPRPPDVATGEGAALDEEGEWEVFVPVDSPPLPPPPPAAAPESPPELDLLLFVVRLLREYDMTCPMEEDDAYPTPRPTAKPMTKRRPTPPAIHQAFLDFFFDV